MRFRELKEATFASITGDQRFWMAHGNATGMADLSGPFVRRLREMDETWSEFCAVGTGKARGLGPFPLESDATVYVERKPR